MIRPNAGKALRNVPDRVIKGKEKRAGFHARGSKGQRGEFP